VRLEAAQEALGQRVCAQYVPRIARALLTHSEGEVGAQCHILALPSHLLRELVAGRCSRQCPQEHGAERPLHVEHARRRVVLAAEKVVHRPRARCGRCCWRCWWCWCLCAGIRGQRRAALLVQSHPPLAPLLCGGLEARALGHHGLLAHCRTRHAHVCAHHLHGDALPAQRARLVRWWHGRPLALLRRLAGRPRATQERVKRRHGCVCVAFFSP
jgi:hypothetical protein